MKILFVSDTYYPHINGVYYFVCRLAPLLQEKGHRVAVIAPSETSRFTKKKVNDIDVYGIPSVPNIFYTRLRSPMPLLLHARLNSLIESFCPDIIHIQDHFILSKACTEIANDLKIPVVGTNHFMPENITSLFPGKAIKSFIERSMWKRFTNVFNKTAIVTTPTSTAASLILSKLNKRILPISCGIDLDMFAPADEVEYIKVKYKLPNKPLLLFVGRLDPEKHIDEIIKAVAIAAKAKDFCFVVVGKGSRRKALESLVESLGLKEQVIFTGFVPDEDLPLLYNACDSFVIASTAELLSIATLQAMASGLPIIAAEAGALKELVKHGINGYLFQPGDIEELARYINIMLTNPFFRKKMGLKSIEFSMQHDIGFTLLAYEELYRRCIDKKPGKAATVISMDILPN